MTGLFKTYGFLLSIPLLCSLVFVAKSRHFTTPNTVVPSDIVMQAQPLLFDSVHRNRYRFWYEGARKNVYLDSFRRFYQIDTLVRGLRSDSARALRLLHWTHRQWSHNGSAEPSRSDAFTILHEAKAGERFRCVEYSIVAATALNAIGLPARVLSLKTKDVETRASSAGHVVLEVYLRDLKKWAVLDGQWNMMPVAGGMPLNAVELQRTLVLDNNSVVFRSLSMQVTKAFYSYWLTPYLYYFDVAFDNREGHAVKPMGNEGKLRLMLVPIGAKEPTVFQQKWPLTGFVYSHSLQDFYAPPY